MNSPSRLARAGGSGKSKLREVKSGILLSDALIPSTAVAPTARVPKGLRAPIIRTKSGNLRKIASKEAFAALTAEEDSSGTRVTSRFARVLLAGSGFLADAYDLFVINLVLRLLRNEYPEFGDANNVSGMNIHELEGSVAAAALVGSIIGQLVAGSLADVIGRKKIFVTTAILITIGSFGSACCGNTSAFTIYGQLACWRFCLGVGVGGEYPLAATVTSESTSAAHRGSLMAGVFSMQGVGSLLSAAVVMACLSLGMSDGFTWRFSLAFGAVPVLLAFPWRLMMHETETFTRVAEERKQEQEASKLCAVGGTGGTDSSGDGGGVGYGSIGNTLTGKNSSGMLLSAPMGMLNNQKSPGYGTSEMYNNLFSDSFDPNAPKNDTKRIGKINSKYAERGGNDYSNERQEPDMEMQMVTDYVFPDSYQNSSPGPARDPNRDNMRNMNRASSISKADDIFISEHQSQQQQCHGDHKRTHMGELRKAITFYKWHMLGTALSWFLLDVDFYANGLFNQKVTSTIFSTPGVTHTALEDAYFASILTLIGIPGYWLSVMYIESVGRKNLQMIGFTMMSLLFLICSLFYTWMMDKDGGWGRKYLFLVLYALTFLFSNFGPNTTSFVIPGEIFPAEVRATCHGLSAASGKLGAATGAFLFPLLLGPRGASQPTNEGIQYTMLICSIVAALGVCVTYLFTPTYGADMLTHEGTYMVLDHACLLPSDEDMMRLDGYELVHGGGDGEDEEQN